MASEPQALSYDTTTPSRPKWVYAVLGLYGVLLLALLTFPIWFGYFVMETGDFGHYAALALCASSIMLVGMTLMIIPVRKRSGRPIRRRAIWLPLIGSSLLVGTLVFAAIASVDDAFPKSICIGGMDEGMVVWGGAFIAWGFWTLVFGWLGLSRDPVSVNSRIYKAMVTGNFLELVIAVPMHIIARQRPECCAGIASACAIGAGAMIAVVVLGPAIFFLYYRRWGQVYAAKRAKGID